MPTPAWPMNALLKLENTDPTLLCGHCGLPSWGAKSRLSRDAQGLRDNLAPRMVVCACLPREHSRMETGASRSSIRGAHDRPPRRLLMTFLWILLGVLYFVA